MLLYPGSGTFAVGNKHILLSYQCPSVPLHSSSSYLGEKGTEVNIEVRKMADKKMAVLKVVPEFGGTGCISEWLEKVKTVCDLNQVTEEEDVVYVIALRLTGSAYTVYQQMPARKKKSQKEIEKALLVAYEVNPFLAWAQFKDRKLTAGESVDEYLAALKRKSRVMGGVSNMVMLCAFVEGLPDRVRKALRALISVEQTSVEEAVIKARTLIMDEPEGVCAAAMSGGPQRQQGGGAKPAVRSRGPIRCHECEGVGHVKSKCPQVECFKCHGKGHFAAACPGNDPRN